MRFARYRSKIFLMSIFRNNLFINEEVWHKMGFF